MKIIGIEDEKVKAKLNKKKVMIASIIGIVAAIILILFIIYCANRTFRNMVDKYVLMKNVIEDSTASIDINEDETNNIFAYDKYISVLSKNTLKNYNSSGKLDGELTVEISNPITDTNGRFLLIAENEKNKIYLVSGNELIWQKDLEGEISKVCVNKNGYVAVILSGTTYKSVIQIFDSEGKELFKQFLSTTTAVDASISLDNQYLAFLELNTSGTTLQSIIKVISIQKAKTTPSESEVYKYIDENNVLITNIKYQQGNRLVYMSDDGINIIKGETNERVLNFVEEGKRISFADVELTNYMYRAIEKSSLLNNETSIEILSTGSKKTSIYTLDSVPRKMYSYNDKIAINLGSEVHFISTNGWLIKRYISSQEIRKIVMANNFAGIVYRNKIEIVNI